MKQLKSEIHQAGIISAAFSAIIRLGLVYRSQFTGITEASTYKLAIPCAHSSCYHSLSFLAHAASRVIQSLAVG
jgi:hypothetical protein